MIFLKMNQKKKVTKVHFQHVRQSGSSLVMWPELVDNTPAEFQTSSDSHKVDRLSRSL